MASLLKCASDSTTNVFSEEKELFSGTYLLKRTPWGTKILMLPVWSKILKIRDTLFELIEIELQCSKNYFKISLSQKKLELLGIT